MPRWCTVRAGPLRSGRATASRKSVTRMPLPSSAKPAAMRSAETNNGCQCASGSVRRSCGEDGRGSAESISSGFSEPSGMVVDQSVGRVRGGGTTRNRLAGSHDTQKPSATKTNAPRCSCGSCSSASEWRTEPARSRSVRTKPTAYRRAIHTVPPSLTSGGQGWRSARCSQSVAPDVSSAVSTVPDRLSPSYVVTTSGPSGPRCRHRPGRATRPSAGCAPCGVPRLPAMGNLSSTIAAIGEWFSRNGLDCRYHFRATSACRGSGPEGGRIPRPWPIRLEIDAMQCGRKNEQLCSEWPGKRAAEAG